MVGSRFEERLTQVVQAELCALLVARAMQLKAIEAEELELEESILVEFQIENRKEMGMWV